MVYCVTRYFERLNVGWDDDDDVDKPNVFINPKNAEVMKSTSKTKLGAYDADTAPYCTVYKGPPCKIYYIRYLTQSLFIRRKKKYCVIFKSMFSLLYNHL